MPGNGIQPRYLAGREEYIESFVRSLQSFEEGLPRNTVLSGLRGTGKTVLLRHFKVIAESKRWLTVEREFNERFSDENAFAEAVVTDIISKATEASWAKRVFSFHYERDVWRAGQVRNSWVTKPDRETAGFWDAASWEEVRRKGEEEVKHWINNQLEGTTVTVVLIGAETISRDYVKYELAQSNKRGNGILGIYIHQIKDSDGRTNTKGNNQFGQIFTNDKGEAKYFWELYNTYDWVEDREYDNLGDWVEDAAKKAGK